MLDDQQISDLLLDLESDRVERKESINDPARIRQAICAFANDMPGLGQPGVLFVGTRDDGSCANLPVTDRLLLTLSEMRSDGKILPLPVMTVQKRTIDGCEMAVIIVEPSWLPPVRLDGRIWIRVGPRRAIASEDEERRLVERRRAANLPWDAQPIAPATLNDLDLDLFNRTYLPNAIAFDVLEQNHRTVEQQLSSLRFLTIANEPAPTVTGLLTIGNSPADFLPGAYVQFLCIGGAELSDPILDQKDCHGPLPQLLRDVEGILQAHIRIATDVTSGPTEIQQPDYPIAALQQVVRNAIMHRDYETSNAPTRVTWYDDRIEIQNPGGPFGQVSVENFGQAGITDYRNPTVAEALKTLGFVQRFGVGIALARKALAENGNSELEFTVTPNHVLVIVRRRS
ncbi:MAG: putative DNA binding domain-containing protein [Planctomycetota bacterium]|nr:putative DNA binding domain-containing protein [Planctomycetota bacterium]